MNKKDNIKKQLMKTFVALLFLAFFSSGYCQILKPGFNKAEYIETLKINHKAHIAVEKWSDIKTVPDRSEELV